jgi:hypothetical protein
MGTRGGRIWRRSCPLYACLSLLGVGIAAALSFASPATAQHHRRHGPPRLAFEPGNAWISTWAASPQAFSPGALGADAFANQTIRNVVFSSAGGTIVRVRFTNVFGAKALDIGRAAIGVAGGGAGVVSGTNVPLSFDGRPWVVVPRGAEVLSDPVSLVVPGQRDLAVSVFLPRAPVRSWRSATRSPTGWGPSSTPTLAGPTISRGTITLTSGSSVASRTAFSNSSGIGGTIVFSRSGRLSVIVAIGPAAS